MDKWKKNVMQDVVRKLQVIRQAQEEAIKAQKQSFQVELGRVAKGWEMKARVLENKIRLLKIPEQRLAQKKPTAKKAHIVEVRHTVLGLVES